MERRSKDPSADLNLQAEIAQLTFRKLVPTAIVSAVLSVGTTSLVAHHVQDPWLWKLAGVMAVICSFRILLPIAFERRAKPELTESAALRWQIAYEVGTELNCCTIAASTIYNFRYHDHTAQFLCMLGVFIVCVGMGAGFGLRPRIAQLCGLTTLGSLAFSIFQQPDPLLARAGCVMIGLFTLLYNRLVADKYNIVVEQLRLQRTMSHLAEHDALTGLTNRRHFEAQLAQICRRPGSFAVLFLDLDGFKKVNDSHGHATGDALLQHVANRLQIAVHHTDLISRLGGDEFAILHQPLATHDSTKALARCILDTVSAPYDIEGNPIRIGTSIGIQLSAPGINDPNRLLSEADDALYKVKQSGKGTFRFVPSTEAVVIAGPTAPSPDADHGGSRSGQNPHNGVGKLLVGIGQ